MLGECSPASRPNAPRAAATLIPNAFWKLWKPAGPSERRPAAPATAPALRWPIAGTQPSGRPRAWVGAPPSGACVGRGGSGGSRAPPGIGERFCVRPALLHARKHLDGLARGSLMQDGAVERRSTGGCAALDGFELGARDEHLPDIHRLWCHRLDSLHSRLGGFCWRVGGRALGLPAVVGGIVNDDCVDLDRDVVSRRSVRR